MGVIELYVLFSVSVGLWACVDMLPEVRKRLFEANRLDDAMYDSPFIAFTVMLIISSLMAPLVVPSILVPSWRAKCVGALVQKV